MGAPDGKYVVGWTNKETGKVSFGMVLSKSNIISGRKAARYMFQPSYYDNTPDLTVGEVYWYVAPRELFVNDTA